MYQQLFVLASVALAIVNAHPGAHTSGTKTTTTPSTFKFTETFPEPGSVPTPKPEWLELIKAANVTKAPVYKVGNGEGKNNKIILNNR